MKKAGTRPALIAPDGAYFFAGSQPFIFGSFLHSSAVGFLSCATTWNDTAANVAARIECD